VSCDSHAGTVLHGYLDGELDATRGRGILSAISKIAASVLLR